MVDPVQTAQATALEIPVTVQGSMTVEGAERRELFTETAKTMLVSENGAVLKLDATVLPGQCVFLRNDKSGREILCKVLESRQAGYIGLEFTVYDPKFWEVPAEQTATSARRPEPEKEVEAVMSNSAPVPTRESSAPTSGEVSAANPETAFPAPPFAQTTEASPEPSHGVGGPDTKDAVPDWDEARDAQLVALLASMDGKSNARRESAAKETKGTGETGSAGTSPDARNQSQTSSKAAQEASAPSLASSVPRRIREFTAKRNPIYLGIVAAVLIAAVLGVVWHAKRSSSTRISNQLSAFPAPSAQRAPSVAGQAPPTSSSPSAASLHNSAPASTQPMQKVQPLTEPQKPGVAVGQRSAAKTTDAGTVRSEKGMEDSAAASEPRFVEPSASSEEGAPGRTIRRNTEETKNGETIPAKIVSQTQPEIPGWATGLDLDPVVKLDALIDEKGNLVEAKPISGPRMLQAAAQRAVALWVFEPGLSDGKPVATHMTLTVEFQKVSDGTNGTN